MLFLANLVHSDSSRRWILSGLLEHYEKTEKMSLSPQQTQSVSGVAQTLLFPQPTSVLISCSAFDCQDTRGGSRFGWRGGRQIHSCNSRAKDL